MKLFEGGTVPYYRTHALGKGHRTAERAVIMIHGHHRNADSYFKTAFRAVARARAQSKTAVFAPDFLAVYDDQGKRPFSDSPASGQLYWDGISSWKRGGASTSAKATRKSSYDVIDHMLARLANKKRWPKLKTVVIAGHSAGGQFVNRYAAGNSLDGQSHLRLYYVVSNPSSYLYLNNKRSQDWGKTWSVPVGCGNANFYHYGLAGGLNRYMMNKTVGALRRDYVRRDVMYLVGTKDTKTKELDTRCAANAQGEHRHMRARTYYRHLDKYFSAHEHRYFEVPKGHSAGDMFTHKIGAAVLTRL